ncbi:hypothetical protein ACIBK8_32845 [Streptomyces sp. NPDC050161]|uniref:hypothetical protein n=1 Tax=Streptomyces sp. NPDC050161 TaxID=3365604 RepID=UPI00378A0EFE
MAQHRHEAVQLQGELGLPTDTEGREVDQGLLADLMGAVLAECGECTEPLAWTVAANTATTVRLVECVCGMAAELNRDEPPRFLWDAAAPGLLVPGPEAPEFRRVASIWRDGGELYEECARLTVAERQTAACSATRMMAVILYTARCRGDADTALLAPASPPGGDGGHGRVLPPSGCLEREPAEGPPTAESDEWQINVGNVLILRRDAGAARLNAHVADDFEASPSDYEHEVGLEYLTCPTCGNYESLLIEGRWGDPLTVHCRCGATATSPAAQSAGPGAGRSLLKRLILCAADPAYAARRLRPELRKHREADKARRAAPWYTGPNPEEIALINSIAPEADDVVQALVQGLEPKLPRRHGASPLALLWIQVAHALAEPDVRNSPDGRLLADGVHAQLQDLREEATRHAQR